MEDTPTSSPTRRQSHWEEHLLEHAVRYGRRSPGVMTSVRSPSIPTEESGFWCKTHGISELTLMKLGALRQKYDGFIRKMTSELWRASWI